MKKEQKKKGLNTMLALVAVGTMVLAFAMWNGNSKSVEVAPVNPQDVPNTDVNSIVTKVVVATTATPTPTKYVTPSGTIPGEAAIRPTTTLESRPMTAEAVKFVAECKAIVKRESEYATVPFLGANDGVKRPYFYLANHPELKNKLYEGFSMLKRGTAVDLSQCVDLPTLFDDPDRQIPTGFVLDSSKDLEHIRGMIAVGHPNYLSYGDYTVAQLVPGATYSADNANEIVTSVVLTNNSGKIDVIERYGQYEGEDVMFVFPNISIKNVKTLNMYDDASLVILIPEGWTYEEGLDYIRARVFGKPEPEKYPEDTHYMENYNDALAAFDSPIRVKPRIFADYKSD